MVSVSKIELRLARSGDAGEGKYVTVDVTNTETSEYIGGSAVELSTIGLTVGWVAFTFDPVLTLTGGTRYTFTIGRGGDVDAEATQYNAVCHYESAVFDADEPCTYIELQTEPG
jgi:hypothetical protein